MEVVVPIVLVVLLALIPAKIAQSKGRSFFAWYVFGLLLWIVALIAALVIRDQRPAEVPYSASAEVPATAAKKCPDCAEMVLADARVCKHCGYRFAPLATN